MILVETLAAYVLAGAVIAIAFMIFGVGRIVPHASISFGARLLLLPGAITLWPLVLARWLKTYRNK